MNPRARLWWSIGWSVLLTVVGAAAELAPRAWTVEGVKREALIFAPADAEAAARPLVFVFHGHGGGMQQAANGQPFHRVWPEALVVYMQGLPTPGRLTDPEGKRPGWQAGPGDQGDRDLKFFDAVLASMKADHRVDPRRIYATGHSNGGAFTYLLWAQRGEVFAAFGPSASVAARNNGTMAPHPVIHVAGEKDPLVKFEWQKAMMELLRRNNECGEGQSVGPGRTLYPSKLDAPVMTYIHPGTHQYPREAPAIIVEFFRQHPKK